MTVRFGQVRTVEIKGWSQFVEHMPKPNRAERRFLRRQATDIREEAEELMTPYRERHEAGQYDAEAPPAPDDDNGNDNGETLAELKAQAEEAGLPTYGTKAQLRERIEEAKAAA